MAVHQHTRERQTDRQTETEREGRERDRERERERECDRERERQRDIYLPWQTNENVIFLEKRSSDTSPYNRLLTVFMSSPTTTSLI